MDIVKGWYDRASTTIAVAVYRKHFLLLVFFPLALTTTFSPRLSAVRVQERQTFVPSALILHCPDSLNHQASKMSALRNTLIRTANGYIDGLNSGTPEGLIAFRSLSCTHQMLPSSLPPLWTGQPKTNEEFQAFMIEGAKSLRNIRIFLVEGEDMIIDEVLRKVVLHLKSTGETDVGPYANEYMIVLTTTEDGQLISQVTEFMDSGYTLNLVSKLMSQAAASA